MTQVRVLQFRAGYRAECSLPGVPDAYGSSPSEALGRLVLAHPATFGLSVKVEQPRPPRTPDADLAACAASVVHARDC